VSVGKLVELRVANGVTAVALRFLRKSFGHCWYGASVVSLPEIGAVSFIQTDVAVNPGNSGGPPTAGEKGGYQPNPQPKRLATRACRLPFPWTHSKIDQIVASAVTCPPWRVYPGEVNQALADSS
jgi:serine protease Do